MRNILARLEELERKSGADIPTVNAEYQNGERIKYHGLPPVDHLFREDNPIIKTSGSDFAELVNAMIHPKDNRSIEAFEGVDSKEKQD